MKNKLMAAFAVSALAMGVSAVAQADAHPYAGLGMGYIYGDNSGNTIGGQVGYHFDKDWSAELSYYDTIDQNEADITSLTGAYRLWGEGDTEILGLASLHNVNMESHGADNGLATGLGVAVSHYLTDQVEVRASVESLVWQDEDTDLDAVATLAVNYHFGTHQEVVEAAPKKAEPAVVMKKTLHVNFDNDKAIVRPVDKAQIAEVAEAMKSSPGSSAELVGHTDSNASESYNQALSERRAAAVKNEMVKGGAPAAAIATSGRGELEPIADNKTKEGRFQNRRVEATVTGLK